MVLEALINPVKAEKKPWELFFLGFLYTCVAMFISIQIFESNAGLIAVFLTVLACMPIFYATIKYEEKKDTLNFPESLLLKEHTKALTSFVFMFLGIVGAFSIWYVLLPPVSAENIFSVQIITINSINGVSGGFVANTHMLSKVFLNNFKVLALCLLFSFFYGAGAIFILSWNASVISVAIGNFFRNTLGNYAHAVGFARVAAYFHVGSLSLLRYLVHGIPEILAYFVGSLAGGIISVAVIRHDFNTKHFRTILLDALDLSIIAVVILFFASMIEVLVIPAFF